MNKPVYEEKYSGEKETEAHRHVQPFTLWQALLSTRFMQHITKVSHSVSSNFMIMCWGIHSYPDGSHVRDTWERNAS